MFTLCVYHIYVVHMHIYAHCRLSMCVPNCRLADSEVRKTAVCWLSGLPDDDLCDFLPQLVQSVRHDCYEASAMSQLLLTRAFTSPRIAHHLYWYMILDDVFIYVYVQEYAYM